MLRLLVLSTIFLPALLLGAASATRQEYSFDAGWLFRRGLCPNGTAIAAADRAADRAPRASAAAADAAARYDQLLGPTPLAPVSLTDNEATLSFDKLQTGDYTLAVI